MGLFILIPEEYDLLMMYRIYFGLGYTDPDKDRYSMHMTN